MMTTICISFTVDIVFSNETKVIVIFNGIVFLDCPIKYVIEFEIATIVKITKLSSQVQIVGLFFKFKLATITYVVSKLIRISLTHQLYRSLQFRIFDLLMLFLLILCRKTHPGQVSFQQVK